MITLFSRSIPSTSEMLPWTQETSCSHLSIIRPRQLASVPTPTTCSSNQISKTPSHSKTLTDKNCWKGREAWMSWLCKINHKTQIWQVATYLLSVRHPKHLFTSMPIQVRSKPIKSQSKSTESTRRANRSTTKLSIDPKPRINQLARLSVVLVQVKMTYQALLMYQLLHLLQLLPRDQSLAWESNQTMTQLTLVRIKRWKTPRRSQIRKSHKNRWKSASQTKKCYQGRRECLYRMQIKAVASHAPSSEEIIKLQVKSSTTISIQ